MFHLQSLELVHWDYCQRVSLPLDASIITIAGPNGSGKTTLLDAMRTLLGLKCSQPRDYKTYARHAGANVAWLRAVVDNSPQNRQTSSRPFAKRLIYSDQVTLACRIDRNGGDWQRRYTVLEGDVSIETLSATPDKDLGLMGIEAWNRLLSAAGLSPAIAKVLSLEQGQTDRLCEYSPRELLRLVFDVFGDQEVLSAYDTAREHQQQLTREMVQAEKELDHSKAQLAELQNKVTNYKNWQHKVQERERLATEVLPVLGWHGERLDLLKRSREQHRQRISARLGQAERERQNARLLDLLGQRSQADEASARLLSERDEAAKQRDATRDQERPLELLAQREQELLALASSESDSAAVNQRLQALEADKAGLEDQLSELRGKQSKANALLESLQGQRTPPPPEEARRFRQRLQSQGITHGFLADIVEVRDERWRAAVEGVLRPNRWMVLLQDTADEVKAFELAEQDHYRHYIVTGSEAAPKATAHSLLAQVKLDAKVPRWLIQQLESLRCVENPREGQQLGGAWITEKAYMHDGRGARSVWVEPRDYQFGAAALQAQRDACERDIARADKALAPVAEKLRDVKRQIDDAKRSLAGHTAAAELARRSEEFADAGRALPAAKQARIAAASRWQQLDQEHRAASLHQQQTESAYRTLEKTLRETSSEAARHAQEWLQRRSQLTAEVDASNRHKRQFPPAWIRPDTLRQLLDTYKNDTQARLRLHAVEEDLAQDTWEKDASVEERYRRMEAAVREQGYSLEDHQVKNAQAGSAVFNARESYIEVLRSTVRRYRKNIQELGALAGVDVAADLPALENDDGVLSQAGLKVNFNFDGKGSIGLNDGEASGGQQVIKSLILLVGLLKDEDSASGGFVFIDEPFAHLDVRNIQLVGHFLRSTQAQYVLTTPITHNLEVFEPAEITLVTSKKPRDSRWAPPIAVAKRRGLPQASQNVTAVT
ncbi:P-loop containing region of AAA domain-containing protein [Polaromonas sp. OV174]|uniref:ATP-binding protein n=1 Tax=Polaromonas sp. OV174 TaxID=1855300 RepID=UPI0008E11959|nr:ATP-binding protein [Polaromonas sp. OV174]SFC71799.1 P-loop containing region of AAA domain-containing protein [Polaromonas sp. OV174]